MLNGKENRLEVFHDEVMAGCDIQKGKTIYRQVRVVIGLGKTQAEIDLEETKSRYRELVQALGFPDEIFIEEPSEVHKAIMARVSMCRSRVTRWMASSTKRVEES